MNLPNGHLLQNGKYRLTQVVGQGGFGITYKGVWFTEVKGPLGTVKTEVPVCIKEYFFKDYCYRDTDSFAVKVHSDTGKTLFDKFKEKLIKEAKILSEVHHPYIVNVLEVFEENNTAYIAMEYISGYSLKQRMEKDGILPEVKVLQYVRQIGTALQFVHEKSILHLDIKPSNILIDKEDNARLIDFGVSKRYDIEQQETSTTMLTLSKGFASIEQYDNEGTQSFSPCPDIYSLGATMYNLLTGKIPTESILRATRPLPKPSELNPVITSKTEAAIMKAMEIIPANRFQSIGEMLAALDLSLIPVSKEKSVLPTAVGNQGTSSSQRETGETTVLYSDKSVSPANDDEQTILRTPSAEGIKEMSSVSSSKKDRQNPRRALFISFLTVLLVLVGSVVAFLLHSNKSVRQASDWIERVDSSDVVVPMPIKVQPKELEIEEVKATPKLVVSEKEKSESDKPKDKSGVKKDKPTVKPELDKKEEKSVSAGPSVAEINTRYAELLAAGKRKLASSDYASAKQLLTEAKDMKLTEEVVRLLITCDERAEEKRIADRKAQYEEKMDFGRYKIVRKKSTGRYGAIDVNGEERIPCKYLSVGKTDNGRAFEREDNLFDIYRSDGTLINSGATYY